MASRSSMPLWKIDEYARLADIELRAVEEFHRQAEKHFRKQLADLEAEYKSRPSSYWKVSVGSGYNRGDELAERRDEINGLLDLNEYFGVMAVHTAFDHFLLKIFRYAKFQGLITGADAQAPFLMFARSLKMLKRDFGIDVNQPFDWKRLDQLARVRNAVAHTGEWIDPTGDDYNRFKAYGFRSTWPLELAKGYFIETRELVLHTCREIARQVVEYVRRSS